MMMAADAINACPNPEFSSCDRKFRSVLDFSCEEQLCLALERSCSLAVKVDQVNPACPMHGESVVAGLSDPDYATTASAYLISALCTCSRNHNDVDSFRPASTVWSTENHMSNQIHSRDLKALDTAHVDWMMDNLDQRTSHPQHYSVEAKRLMMLKTFQVLDVDPEPAFERITALASRIFNAPMAFISLVDMGRQFLLSSRGMGDGREGARKESFCGHTILTKRDLFIVNDTLKDERFKNNPFVTSGPKLRFYAGVPLIADNGYALGSFCIGSYLARPEGLSLEEKQNLRELAALTVDTLRYRRQEKLKETLTSTSPLHMCDLIESPNLQANIEGVHETLTTLMDHTKKAMTAYEGSSSDASRSLVYSQIDLIQRALTFSNAIRSTYYETKASKISNPTHKRSNSSDSSHTSGSKKRNCSMTVEDNSIESLQSVSQTEIPSKDTHCFVGKKGHDQIIMPDFLQHLQRVMSPYPKAVPLEIELSSKVPTFVTGDELIIMRSAISLMTISCKRLRSGQIKAGFDVVLDDVGLLLVFECKEINLNAQKMVEESKFIEINGTECNDDKLLAPISENIKKLGGACGRRSSAFNASDEFPAVTDTFWFSLPLKRLSKRSPSASYQAQLYEKRDDPVMLRGGGKRPTCSRGFEKQTKRLNPQENEADFRTNPPLPQEVNFQRLLPQNICKNAPDRLSTRKRRVLIIDDSEIVRKMISRTVINFGWEALEANNGMEGLRIMKNEPMDVVMCDFLMPIMDGIDCVKELRRFEKEHRPWFKQFIVGISGHASILEAKQGMASGMDAFVVKPVPLQFVKALPSSPEVKEISKQLDDLYVKGLLDISDGNDDVSSSHHS